jgi:hypothetical protein
MYFTIVALLLFICPFASVVIEAGRSHHAFTDLVLIGRWWTFWAVGVRLLLAGIRQVVQPRFTAEAIFEFRDPAVFPLIREIGFGNLSMGTLGIWSLFQSEWVLPAALVGGLYYGLAGLGHIPEKHKNATQYTAMISDGFACMALLSFAIKSLV